MIRTASGRVDVCAWFSVRLTTILLALASVVVTGVGASGVLGDPRDWPMLVTWLMHGDARHLVCDVAAMTAIGWWLEPRAGSRRMLVWALLAAAMSAGTHAIAYPEQARIFGASAVGYALVFAAVFGWALDRAWGIGLLLALAAMLIDESLSGTSAVLRATTQTGAIGGAAGPWRTSFLEGAVLTPTPRVHVACAALGATLGWAIRTDERTVARSPSMT